MLRTNLSTRPFYNERGVHAVLLIVAAFLLVFTAWQVVRVVSLSRYKTELTRAIQRDRTESGDLTRKAADVRRGMNQEELTTVAAAAKEANTLIEQRTFSWTALFNQLEATLPADVMLMAVHPEFQEGGTRVDLELQARRSEDIEEFWERLEKTGQFHGVQWSGENVGEDGLHKMTMEAVYTPPVPAPVRPASAAVPPAAPQPGGRR